jgi:predicted membrane metal-binding protein
VIDIDEHDAVSVGSERSFGIVFSVVFALIGLWPLIHGAQPRWWAIAVAAVFLAAGLLFPLVLKPLNIIWFKFGMLLGRIVGPIVMGLIFFIAVTPTALIFKLRRKDLLKLAQDPDARTYWIARDETMSGSMRDQF